MPDSPSAALVASWSETHEVTNQPPAFAGYDCFSGDAALREAVVREGAGWIEPEASALAVLATSERVQDLARAANRHAPELKTHDRWGRRADRVEMVALAIQGCLLVRHAPAAVADGFCASRLDGDGGRMFGALPGGADARPIVGRARLARAPGSRG